MLESMPGSGFAPESREIVVSAAAALPADPSPHDVEGVLSLVEQAAATAIFIDEFDRVVDPNVSRPMADTIKTLSDQGVDSTIVLVGVASDVSQMIAEHASIERGLSQIPMPPMSRGELREIVRRGLGSVSMTIDDDAAARNTALSQVFALHTPPRAGGGAFGGMA